MRNLLLFTYIVILLFACKSGRNGNNSDGNTPMPEVALTSKGTIYVYRYNGFSEKVTAAAIAELEKYYPRVEEAGELELPEWAKYKPKGCYTGFCRNCQEYLKAKNWRFNL